MPRILAVVVGPLLLALPVSAQQPRTDPTLTKMAQELATAFNARDSAKVASLYAEDATLMPPNEPAVTGRQNIEAWFKKGMDQGVNNLELVPTESSTSESLAFEAGTYSITMNPSAGGTQPAAATTAAGSSGQSPMAESGKYVVVLRRVAGEWKIAYDIFNSDKPMMQPPGR